MKLSTLVLMMMVTTGSFVGCKTGQQADSGNALVNKATLGEDNGSKDKEPERTMPQGRLLEVSYNYQGMAMEVVEEPRLTRRDGQPMLYFKQWNGEKSCLVDDSLFDAARNIIEQERMYAYSQSSQIESQTGCIGHLRADMDSNGKRFFSSWTDYRGDLKTQSFKDEFDERLEQIKIDHVIENNLKNLLDTLEFYEAIADLTDIQREILKLKEKKEKNADIAGYINRKYGKSYTANYISTIFKQKIIGKINEAAALHQDTIENCFFPENFKQCTCCGKILLLDGRNWVKKTRSKDGFQSRCKRCERELRKKKKEGL